MASSPGPKLDAPFYTDAELDALYETDPVAATRLLLERHLWRRRYRAIRAVALANPEP